MTILARTMPSLPLSVESRSGINMMSSTHIQLPRERLENMAARAVIALVSVADVVATDLTDHLDRRGHDVRQARQPWEAESLLAGKGIDVVVVGDSLSQAEGRELLRRYGGQGEGGRNCPDFILICRPSDLVDKVLAL